MSLKQEGCELGAGAGLGDAQLSEIRAEIDAVNAELRERLTTLLANMEFFQNRAMDEAQQLMQLNRFYLFPNT